MDTIINSQTSLPAEIDRLDKEIALMETRSNMQFNLTPVGQALKQFEVNQRMGQMYAASTIVPSTFQNNVSNCAIAVDMAIRMNANPLMVMQNLYIVHGRPAWSSSFLVATINTCGRFKPLKYRFFTDGKIGKIDYYETEYYNGKPQQVKKTFDGSKIENLCCVAYTTAKGSDELLESSVVSCRLAAMEGWWEKKQSKWPTMTEQMLRYRAAAFWQRAYAPEISMGFHTAEEQQDITDVAFTEVPIAKITQASNLAELAMRNARKESVEPRAEDELPAESEPQAFPQKEESFSPSEDNAPEFDIETGELFTNEQ